MDGATDSDAADDGDDDDVIDDGANGPACTASMLCVKDQQQHQQRDGRWSRVLLPSIAILQVIIKSKPAQKVLPSLQHL